jgi:hypothetical protein
MYFKLLDNEKIAALLQDKKLFKELQKIDFKKLFSDIRKSKKDHGGLR